MKNKTIKEVRSLCHCNLNTHFPHNRQSLTLTACNYKFWSAQVYRSAGSCRTHISIGHWNVYIACPAEHQNIAMRKEIAIRKSFVTDCGKCSTLPIHFTQYTVNSTFLTFRKTIFWKTFQGKNYNNWPQACTCAHTHACAHARTRARARPRVRTPLHE